MPIGLCRGSPRSESRRLDSVQLVPDRARKNIPSFVDTSGLKDNVKDTLWISVLYEREVALFRHLPEHIKILFVFVMNHF